MKTLAFLLLTLSVVLFFPACTDHSTEVFEGVNDQGIATTKTADETVGGGDNPSPPP